MKAGRRLTVDRIEGDLAIVLVDGGPLLDLPLWMLPDGCREGDVLIATSRSGEPGTSNLRFTRDVAASRDSREAVATRLQRLRSRDAGGDLKL